MKKNVGNTDRIIRLILAALITLLYFTGVIGPQLGAVLLIVAAILVVTSFVSFCPLYALFGANTCKTQ